MVEIVISEMKFGWSTVCVSCKNVYLFTECLRIVVGQHCMDVQLGKTCINYIKFCACVFAVSYTHLDVYKRQLVLLNARMY